MSVVDNYIVMAGPEHDDDDSDNLGLPWVRIDHNITGDHKGMEARVWARVTNHRSHADIIAELQAHHWIEPDEVLVAIKLQGRDWDARGLTEWKLDVLS